MWGIIQIEKLPPVGETTMSQEDEIRLVILREVKASKKKPMNIINFSFKNNQHYLSQIDWLAKNGYIDAIIHREHMSGDQPIDEVIVHRLTHEGEELLEQLGVVSENGN